MSQADQTSTPADDEDDSPEALAAQLARAHLIHNKRIDQMSGNLANGALAVITAGVLIPIIDLTYGSRELMQRVGDYGPWILSIWLFLALVLYYAARWHVGDAK